MAPELPIKPKNFWTTTLHVKSCAPTGSSIPGRECVVDHPSAHQGLPIMLIVPEGRCRIHLCRAAAGNRTCRHHRAEQRQHGERLKFGITRADPCSRAAK